MTDDDGNEPRSDLSRAVTSAGQRLVPEVVRRNAGMKFLVSFLLVVVVIAAVGTVNFYSIRNTVQSESTDKLRSTAQIRADIVSQWVSGKETQARIISDSEELTADEPARARLYLEDAQEQATEDVLAMHYVNVENWTVTESTDITYVDRNVSDIDEPWTTRLREMEPSTRVPSAVASTSVAFRYRNQWAVAFASPTPGANTALVLVGSIERPIDEFDQFPSLSTTIINARGEPLIDRGGGNGTAHANASTFGSDGETTRTVERDGNIRVYAPVNGTTWVAVTTAPKASVFQSARAVSTSVITIILASVATLTVLAFGLGRHMVVPLVRLRSRTEQLKRGNFDVDLSTSRTDEVGRLYRDFDEMRTALREQMRETEESKRRVEEQNERLETLVNMLSHDLRNPLTVVQGRLQLIRDSIPAEHMSSIDRSIDRMQTIIDDVLTLAREDDWSLDTGRVALADAVERAWASTTTEDATLVVDTDAAIEADERHLAHLLENLFRNSVEHGSTGSRTPSGDSVEHGSTGNRPAADDSAEGTSASNRTSEQSDDNVEHGSTGNRPGADRPVEEGETEPLPMGEEMQARVEGLRESVTVRVTDIEGGFAVEDDGPGIPEDERERVFDLGYTTTDPGTGLGLNIVRNIVETHGWTVDITDSDAGGVRFEFTGVERLDEGAGG